MGDDAIRLALNLGGTTALLVVTYLIGSWLERRHYRDLGEREAETRAFATVTLRKVPTSWEAERGELVMGSVVISVDYFKRFLAGLRGVVGGRVSAYEGLLDRARREAILRMKADAKARGFDAVIHTRLETSRLASSGRDGKGTAGVEVLAFGTGVRLRSAPPPGPALPLTATRRPTPTAGREA